jgi:hypothetical protein
MDFSVYRPLSIVPALKLIVRPFYMDVLQFSCKLLNLCIIVADCSPYVCSPPRTPLGVLNGLLATTPNSASSRGGGTPSGTPRTPAEERVLKKVGLLATTPNSASSRGGEHPPAHPAHQQRNVCSRR